ncbi:MAG: YitT family protein, partial [Clostridia bacterium]|nr:YitT family protein [Clostridia bacterium]
MIKIKNKWLDIIVHAVLVYLGTFIAAAAFSIMLVPHDIIPGGFGGLSQLISEICAEEFNFHITKGTVSLLINLPLYVLSVKMLGSRFGVLSVVGVLGYSLNMDIVTKYIYSLPAVQNAPQLQDPLICAVFGGLILGVGIGFIVRMGGSTGGTDMLAFVIAAKRPNLKISQLVLAVDLVVVGCAMLYHGFFSALYAFVSIFAQSKAIEAVADGNKVAKAYYIISDKSEEIADKILYQLHRGVTAYPSKGMYTGKARDVLMVICLRHQVAELKNIVVETDPHAFMYSSPVTEALGEGFVKPTPTGKPKMKKPITPKPTPVVEAADKEQQP